MFDTSFFIGLAIAPAAVLVGIFLWKQLVVVNPESHETLQLRFGRLNNRTHETGVAGSRLAPYDRWITVSRQWDERLVRAVETNDSQGTMVKVDLRVMFRIADGDRALFTVHDWEEALESTVIHEAGAALAGRDRERFLRNSPELSTGLTTHVRATMAAYGIEIRDVRILNVELRPEVARQMFEAVAARLEVAKGEYEERGRTEAALRLARTEQHVAELEAQAKAENLKAVGRAYQDLRRRPEIFEAYTDLYRLSQLDPARVVSFDGFDEGELSRAALVESDLDHEGGAPRGRNGVSSRPTTT
ncbi:MAG: SPFH/Band 7/PHB domain protein [Deltaproteobacteria bacterium]|nr:SPFH/Band 7/PHB domain protein [Deltaproteobacteria bacterium]MCW5807552.1 SPFH/Band 7/PHB domain protein [Deltaproteobacteria bacterium]